MNCKHWLYPNVLFSPVITMAKWLLQNRHICHNTVNCADSLLITVKNYSESELNLEVSPRCQPSFQEKHNPIKHRKNPYLLKPFDWAGAHLYFPSSSLQPPDTSLEPRQLLQIWEKGKRELGVRLWSPLMYNKGFLFSWGWLQRNPVHVYSEINPTEFKGISASVNVHKIAVSKWNANTQAYIFSFWWKGRPA